MKENPGSGSARNAEKRERTKEVTVDRRTECTYVLFVPFHIPHEPSADHVAETAAITDEEDLRSRKWRESFGFGGGGCGVWTRGTPSGGLLPRRDLEARVGVCARGAEEVK